MDDTSTNPPEYLRGPDGTLYIFAKGVLRRLSDASDFRDVSHAELSALPQAPRPKSGADDLASAATFPATHFDTGNVDLGAGHYMQSAGGVTVQDGTLTGVTHTFTTTDLGGFHGGVVAFLIDSNDNPIPLTPRAQSMLHIYGVDGRWIGNSDRHDQWTYNFSSSDSARAVAVQVWHSWNPDSFQTILNKWVAAGASMKQLADDAAAIAKDYKQIVSSGH